LIEIESKTAEKNSAQTNRQTNKQTSRQTDTHYENNGHWAVNQYREFASTVCRKNRCMREIQLNCTRMFIITARRSYASAVLDVVILPVCPLLCHTRALLLCG